MVAHDFMQWLPEAIEFPAPVLGTTALGYVYAELKVWPQVQKLKSRVLVFEWRESMWYI